MKIVLFLGYSGSGKTTAMEHVTRALVREGFRVGAVKHIHDPNFTIDTPGKDTWKLAKAGASMIVALAANEHTVIRRKDTSKLRLNEIIGTFEKERYDFVLVEGLHKKFAKRSDVARVLCARDVDDAVDLVKQHGKKTIVCIIGKIGARNVSRSTKEPLILGIPLLSLPRDTEKVLNFIRK